MPNILIGPLADPAGTQRVVTAPPPTHTHPSGRVSKNLVANGGPPFRGPGFRAQFHKFTGMTVSKVAVLRGFERRGGADLHTVTTEKALLATENFAICFNWNNFGFEMTQNVSEP